MAAFPDNGVKYNPKNIRGSISVEAPVSIAGIVKGKCSIGYLSYIGADSEIYNTHIGRFCSIAQGFVSGPTNHPTDRLSSHLFAFANNGPFKGCSEFTEWLREPLLQSNSESVKIGHDVWIGRNVTIKRGVTIGDGAIIGAGSVVTKSVAPYAIVGGVPAKLIRFRFDKEIITQLETLNWFNYDLRNTIVEQLDVVNIEASIAQIDQLIRDKAITKLTPKRFSISSTALSPIG